MPKCSIENNTRTHTQIHICRIKTQINDHLHKLSIECWNRNGGKKNTTSTTTTKLGTAYTSEWQTPNCETTNESKKVTERTLVANYRERNMIISVRLQRCCRWRWWGWWAFAGRFQCSSHWRNLIEYSDFGAFHVKHYSKSTT